MSGSNIKYKGREGNKINSFLLYYNRSDLHPIV